MADRDPTIKITSKAYSVGNKNRENNRLERESPESWNVVWDGSEDVIEKVTFARQGE